MSDFVAWIPAAIFLGLWWGERGRRLDAQRREGIIPVDPPAPAKVLQPGPPLPIPAEAIKQARETFIRETMAEGHSRKDAEAEYDRLMVRAHTDEQGGW